MVTFWIDEWPLTSLYISFTTILIVILSIKCMDYRSELQMTEERLERVEEYYQEYKHKYFKLLAKYNKLKEGKGVKE